MVSASAGLLNPRDVISASAGSSRPPKHDRHGNPVSAPAAHSHPGSVVSASAGHGQGGRDSGSVQSAPNSVAPFPLFTGGATADFSVDGGATAKFPMDGGANAKFPIDGFELPRESSHGLAPNTPWKEENSASAGSFLPMEVDNWVGIEPSASAGANFQNFVVRQTIVFSEACVFGNVTQTTLHDTRVAVETTIHVAEERHQQVVNASFQAHQQEMESVRRDARAAQEANKSLQEMVLRLQHGASTEAARSTRLRELEIAFEIQSNEMQTMQREKESAADAVQAHAAAWAAAIHSDTSSSGNHFHELSSGGTASQPGVLSSLSKNVFGYAKGAPSEQATTCPTAGGYEGSQSSLPERQLYHIDLYTPDPEIGVAPGGRAEHSVSYGVPGTAAAGRPISSQQALSCLWFRSHLDHR